MKNINLSLFFTTLLVLISSVAKPTYASICNVALGTDCGQSVDPKRYTNQVLSAVFSIFFIVGILYFMWNMLFNAYHLLSAEGDPKAYETAKNGITHGLMGIAVIFSVFAIIKTVGYIFGITGLDTLSIEWPTL